MSILELLDKRQRLRKKRSFVYSAFLSFISLRSLRLSLNASLSPAGQSGYPAKELFCNTLDAVASKVAAFPESSTVWNQLFLLIQTRKKPQNTLRTIPVPREYSAQSVKLLLAKGNASMDAMSQKKPVRASIIGYMGEIGS